MPDALALRSSLQWAYRKNLEDLLWMARGGLFRALSRGDWSRWGQPPIFVFHSVEPESFRKQLLFLRRNGYTAVTSRELAAGNWDRRRSLVLTFDDARLSLWTHGFPLLREFEVPAVVFAVPGCVGEGAEATQEDSRGREVALCSWEHLAAMAESGLVDVQSHTHRHLLVETGPHPIGFLSPAMLGREFANTHLPLAVRELLDEVGGEHALGVPVQPAAPLLSVKQRIVLSEGLRQACLNHVRSNGGRAFFHRRGWQAELRRVFRDALDRSVVLFRREELGSLIEKELRDSRVVLEQKLGRRVNHLCLPWFTASPAHFDLMRACGYAAVHWGPQPASWSTQRRGGLFHYWRVDGTFLTALPGDGREPVVRIVARRFRRTLMAQRGSRRSG